MQTVSYKDVETATAEDIGKIALYCLGGAVMAIENTLDDCIKTARACGFDVDADMIDDHTDFYYLNTESIVAAELV
jgi:hypothetical protein